MGGTSTTTQNTSAKPYGPAKGLIKGILRDARGAYGDGYGGQVYTGSTVVPFAQQTTQGMNGVMGLAGQNVGGAGMSGNLQSILNNGGFSDTQNRAMTGMEGDANSAALSRMINGDGLTDQQRAALGRMEGTATGQFNLDANPAYQQVLQNMLQSSKEGVNANAAAMGRYGGDAHQGILAGEQGKIAANMAMDEYRNWQNRADTANRDVASLSQQGVGNQMGALGQRSGLLSQLFNAQQAGIGNMGAAYDTAQKPYTSMMGIGSMYEDLYKRQKDDELRIFNESQNAPLQNFQNYLGVANMTGAYAPRNTVTQAPGPNPLLMGLSGATSGIGMLGSLFGGFGTGAPTGLF